MNLFIDTLSSPACLILFTDTRNILDTLSWEAEGKESATLIGKIYDFLEKNNSTLYGIENIVIVNGPGSFTGLRTVSLVANTINFLIEKNIFPLSYFDLFSSYPIIKQGSKHDAFIKLSPKGNISIMKNDYIKKLLQKKDIQKTYGDFILGETVALVDYKSILSKISLHASLSCKIVQPFYIKKPSIS